MAKKKKKEVRKPKVVLAPEELCDLTSEQRIAYEEGRDFR